MLDERELENRIERIPAAPERLIEMCEYAVKPGSEATFEGQWREFAAQRARRDGCIFLRLHRAVEKTSHFITYDLWESRLALMGAIRSLPDEPGYLLAGEAHRTYIRLVTHVGRLTGKGAMAQPGQVASLRRFSVKIGSQREFETLWNQSARDEARQEKCLYKRLHGDLNLPTFYVSYSLWADRAAPDEAASHHAHYQSSHKPYPLANPVLRSTLDVVAHLVPSKAESE
jgi:quinol monooxygenase YgiN